MKYITLFITLMASVLTLSAQSAQDAITFGQQYHGGTARYMSMGGAFNALGGDFSTLSVNPAGLGIYRSNEFSLTGDLRFSSSTTGFSDDAPLSPLATEMTETKTNFNLNSVGYVAGSDMGSDGLVRLNFGFGYNRLKNYHKSYRGEVLGSAHSLTDSWAQPLDGASSGAFVADQAYLMNRVDNGNGIELMSPLIEGATTDYVKNVIEEGRINEWVFSVGGNVGHVLYFGGTFGIQDINIEKQYTQTEYFLNTPHSDPFYNDKSYHRFSDDGATEHAYEANDEDYFNYYSQEYTNGTGLNGKFGIIVRPLDIFRFGVAVHSPTINFVTVDHYAELYNNTYYIDDNNEETSGGKGFEDPASQDYRTVSPYKVHASAAIILGKFLAIDAEVDMIDYSTMKIKDTNGGSYAYNEANASIKEMYKTSYNARIGAEMKFAQVVALRAGAAYYGSPYENNITYDGSNNMVDAADYSGDRFDYSAGFGIRSGDFFLDMAYIKSIQKNRTMVFDGAISPNGFEEMKLDDSTNRFMMTMGFKF